MGITFALALVLAPAQAADYPPIVREKQLYAAKDFRGEKAPKLEFGKVLNGKLPDLKGKTVLVDFWATWCGPCRALSPSLTEWQEKFKDDLVIVAVSDEAESVLTEYLSKTKVGYLVTSDPEKTLSKQLGVRGIPHVMIVSPDGVVRWQGFPGSDEDKLTPDKIGQIIAASKAKGG
jgi:thiol-disulfide isomerase/thioredoxin